MRQTPPPSKCLKGICLLDKHDLDTLKNDAITVQILKEGRMPPTVYQIPEVSLADVLKKEKIEEVDGLFTGANLYRDHKCVLRFFLDEETYEKKKHRDLRFKAVSLDTCEHLQREGSVPLNLFAYEDQPQ